MTKREAKIISYNMIGDHFLFFSDFLEGSSAFTYEEKEKIIKEIDTICNGFIKKSIILRTKKLK